MTNGRKPVIVIADPLSANGLDLLRQEAEVVTAADQNALRSALPEADALIVRSRTKVTADLLDQAPRLRLVGRAGIGVDNVDVDAATQRGVLVMNAPLGNVRSTAEHTLALIFALARRVPAADRAVRDATWKSGYEGTQLAGKRLGVIGLGKVGSTVARVATALGMDVVGYDPYLPQDVWESMAVRQMDLAELLTTADIVTLHVPLMAETRNLLNAEALATMKPTAFLVNCARGGLVNEAALTTALKEGRLAGAALDVFENEPLQESPLLDAPNTILTPHVAASTAEAQSQVSRDIAVQVLDFFRGGPIAFAINPHVLQPVAATES